MKKQNKIKSIYILLMFATFVVAFNNAGQFLTFVEVPFSRTFQFYVGIISIIILFVWYSYLEGAIK